MVDLVAEEEIQKFLAGADQVIGNCLDVMPSHADHIAANCAAPKP